MRVTKFLIVIVVVCLKPLTSKPQALTGLGLKFRPWLQYWWIRLCWHVERHERRKSQMTDIVFHLFKKNYSSDTTANVPQHFVDPFTVSMQTKWRTELNKIWQSAFHCWSHEPQSIPTSVVINVLTSKPIKMTAAKQTVKLEKLLDPKWSRMMQQASNLSLTSCDLDLVLLIPKLTASCHCLMDHLCHLHLNWFTCFQHILFTSFVTDERTDGRTDNYKT